MNKVSNMKFKMQSWINLGVEKLANSISSHNGLSSKDILIAQIKSKQLTK